MLIVVVGVFVGLPIAWGASLPVYKVNLAAATARRLPVGLLVLGLRVLWRTIALRWLLRVLLGIITLGRLLRVLSWIIALTWLLILVPAVLVRRSTISVPSIITVLS